MVVPVDVDPMEAFFLSLDRRMKFPKNGRSSGRFQASFPWKGRSCKTLPIQFGFGLFWLVMVTLKILIPKTNPDPAILEDIIEDSTVDKIMISLHSRNIPTYVFRTKPKCGFSGLLFVPNLNLEFLLPPTNLFT